MGGFARASAELRLRRRVARGGRRGARHAALRLQPRGRSRRPTRPTRERSPPVPHRICYAVKANGNVAILRLLAASSGAGADIVSGGELRAALRAGFPPERIVFAGVGKTRRRARAGARARDRRLQRRERGRDRAARAAAAAPGHARARLAAREPRHRPALAPLHLDRPAREQVRRRHRRGARDPAPGPRACRGSRWSACSATSARRSPRPAPLAAAARALRRAVAAAPGDEGFALRHARHRRRPRRRLRRRGVRRDPPRLAARCCPGSRACRLTLVLEPGRSLVAPAGRAAHAGART